LQTEGQIILNKDISSLAAAADDVRDSQCKESETYKWTRSTAACVGKSARRSFNMTQRGGGQVSCGLNLQPPYSVGQKRLSKDLSDLAAAADGVGGSKGKERKTCIWRGTIIIGSRCKRWQKQEHVFGEPCSDIN
jgi:hypothetical protein